MILDEEKMPDSKKAIWLKSAAMKRRDDIFSEKSVKKPLESR